MYKTKEIRWFFKNHNPSIENWFQNKGLSFVTSKPRTDRYLPLPDQENLSVKLREEKLEVKKREQPASEGKIAAAEGMFEDWVKWCFPVDTKEETHWLAVKKNRLAIKITKDHKQYIFASVDDLPPFGCQVDYVKLLIKNQTWHTVGFEWFGDHHMTLDANIVIDIVEAEELNKKNSMSYPQFLRDFF